MFVELGCIYTNRVRVLKYIYFERSSFCLSTDIIFTIKVHMPTVQFDDVPNKTSISYTCCVYAIMVIYYCNT